MGTHSKCILLSLQQCCPHLKIRCGKHFSWCRKKQPTAQYPPSHKTASWPHAPLAPRPKHHLRPLFRSGWRSPSHHPKGSRTCKLRVSETKQRPHSKRARTVRSLLSGPKQTLCMERELSELLLRMKELVRYHFPLGRCSSVCANLPTNVCIGSALRTAHSTPPCLERETSAFRRRSALGQGARRASVNLRTSWER